MKNQREIKFRAWDGKLMHTVSELSWMQYTGLKDKNGKEIYEGDIISVDGGGEQALIGKVIFEEGCFCLKYRLPMYNMNKQKIKNNTPELKYYIDMSFCEAKIIGNIYENPELLD